jgi:hypothetical protein
VIAESISLAISMLAAPSVAERETALSKRHPQGRHRCRSHAVKLPEVGLRRLSELIYVRVAGT